jgi:hypothetical protein
MRFNQSVAVALAFLALSTAEACFAQQTLNQQQSLASDNSQAPADVGIQTVKRTAPNVLERTRDEVMHELETFQNSEQAAQMRELYRGN